MKRGKTNINNVTVTMFNSAHNLKSVRKGNYMLNSKVEGSCMNPNVFSAFICV